MARRYYNLPSLTTLAVFEAAARHLSFKVAAQELSVTPGAVSHQVKALEQELGAALFARRHRGVELTADGELLRAGMSDALTRLSQAVTTIRQRSTPDTVTVGATSAVAALWLAPSVSRFWREHPDIAVNQVVSDRSLSHLAHLDLVIRYGRDPGSALEHTELYRDRLVPVAAPEMARKLAGAPLEELAQQRLIHLESDDRTWTSWADWFSRLGCRAPLAAGVRVNNYTIALQSAQDGAGLVLGWARLIAPYLKTGALMPIAPHGLTAPNRFYIVSRPECELSQSAARLRRWILDETAMHSGEVNSSLP